MSLFADLEADHRRLAQPLARRMRPISLDEFVIAFFLSGTEPTLPVYIWSQLRFPRRIPSVMALGTLLLLLSISLLTLSEILRRRSARRLGQKDTSGAW